ncbi:hypothetical protein ANANG_G00094310 [Anguilla anguilla]|uniref:Uncharacterized protein n=1 Tax=Anguilla anguilla TaxID=7936 RepID=A0A9D3MMC8_ANGAN|nr:hypothetical protein ANANG_G00094310 [Anguilla anguilla]
MLTDVCISQKNAIGTWEMRFNIAKCKVLHVGNENIRQDYVMGGTKLECAQLVKDLGVMVDQRFSGTTHSVLAVKKKKTNRMLGYIPKIIKYKSKEVALIFFNTFVKSHKCIVRYSIVCSSGECITRQIYRGSGKGSKEGNQIDSRYERLKMLNLFKLKSKKRFRGDLIEAFKFIKGINKVN